MTAKHYRMFAEAMRRVRPNQGNIAYTQWVMDVTALCDMFVAHSSGFNRNQFMDNAGATAPLEALSGNR